MQPGLDTLGRLRGGALAGARRIDLRGAGLGSVPPELYGLADTLEILDLGANPIAALPHDFARFRRLRVLFCSGAPMRVLPEVLGACAALEQVGLRASGVEIVPDAALPPLLRWLTLTGNRIEALPDAIGARPRLAKLMLAGNRLARLPEAMAGATGLELLRLSSNRFEVLPPFLGALPRLAWLAAAGNPATGGAARSGAGTAIPWSSLRCGAVLGEGASGIVRAAAWRRPGAAGPEPVAVKLFRAALTSDGEPAHEMAASLGAGPHPALPGAHGRVADHPEGAEGLVMPLLPDGFRPLADPPSLSTCTRDVYDPSLRLAPGAALRILQRAAEAGAHLAARGFSNGDLYAHNLHWDGAAGEAVVADLGAATRAADPSQAALLERCDVRAWGVLAHELLGRLADGAAVDPALASVASRAASPAPADRPRFAEILRALPAGPPAGPDRSGTGRAAAPAGNGDAPG